MNKKIANVEEADNLSDNQAEEVVEAGGVFWLNAVEGSCCDEGFQTARKLSPIILGGDSYFLRPILFP